MLTVLAIAVPALAVLALVGLVVMHVIDRHHEIEDLFDHDPSSTPDQEE